MAFLAHSAIVNFYLAKALLLPRYSVIIMIHILKNDYINCESVILPCDSWKDHKSLSSVAIQPLMHVLCSINANGAYGIKASTASLSVYIIAVFRFTKMHYFVACQYMLCRYFS